MAPGERLSWAAAPRPAHRLSDLGGAKHIPATVFLSMILELSGNGWRNAKTKRDRPWGSTSFENKQRYSLRRAGLLLFGFRKHATDVQRIVNNLTNCRSLWIHVHSVARF